MVFLFTLLLLRNQPEMCKWNCAKLSEAIKWALPERLAREELPVFDVEYDRCVCVASCSVHC
jgi:hypothetical protein